MTITTMARRIALVILMLAAPAVADAQSSATLRGLVLAAANGAPLPAARVTLRARTGGVELQGESDASGEFRFQDVTPGEYLLAADAAGFSAQQLALDLVPREVRYLVVRMTIQPVAATIDVVAPAAAVLGTHSPSSTTINAERLAALPLGASLTVPDAVASSVPGMIKGHDDLVHVRGQELGLYPAINGITFWENPHAVFSASLSPSIIDTANVMTGGFPAEYGNRFGGVLDLVTKSGWSMNGTGRVIAGGGGAGRASGSAEYGNHSSRFAYYLHGAWSMSDRFLSPPEPRARHDAGGAGHLAVQLDFAPSARDSFQLLVMGDGTDFEVPKTELDEALRPGASASQRNVQQTAIVTWRRAAMSGARLSTSFYQRQSESRLSPATHPLAAFARYDRSLSTMGVKSMYEGLAGRHAIRAGGDVVLLRPHERFDYRYGGVRELTHLLGLGHVHFASDVAADLRETGTAAAAFVQDMMQVTERLTVDAGLRLDRYDVIATALHASPRVNVAYKIGDMRTIVHASYNHLFSPPPMEGLLVSSAGLTAQIREIGHALPPLAPTVEDQIELGAARTFGGGFALSLTGYTRASDKPVHSVIWPDSRVYSYATFDRARSHGVELKAELPPADARWYSGFLNYAVGRAWFYGPVRGGFVADPHELEHAGRFLAPMDQTHTVTAGLRFAHAPTRSRIDLGMLYGSGTPVHRSAVHEHAEDVVAHADTPAAAAPEAGRVPAYFTQSVTLTVQMLRRVELQASVENLTDRPYALASESIFSPSQYSIPRLFSAALRWNF
jgi:outer membrane receptor protein involved in Fe transport